MLFDAVLSLELLQTALLIHDDIMDQDVERRGGATIHVAMAPPRKDTDRGAELVVAGRPRVT